MTAGPDVSRTETWNGSSSTADTPAGAATAAIDIRSPLIAFSAEGDPWTKCTDTAESCGAGGSFGP